MAKEEKVVVATVFRNDGTYKGGKRLMVHSDFQRFLKEAGQLLDVDNPVYAFTYEGGEIESSYDVLHDDVIFISSGELLM